MKLPGKRGDSAEAHKYGIVHHAIFYKSRDGECIRTSIENVVLDFMEGGTDAVRCLRRELLLVPQAFPQRILGRNGTTADFTEQE